MYVDFIKYKINEILERNVGINLGYVTFMKRKIEDEKRRWKPTILMKVATTYLIILFLYNISLILDLKQSIPV